jgi:hypothetical protein
MAFHNLALKSQRIEEAKNLNEIDQQLAWSPVDDDTPTAS